MSQTIQITDQDLAAQEERLAEERKKILVLKSGLLVILVGPRGGGKTTAASWFVQDRKESEPNIPRISNVPIEGAIYVPDILKFLATKLKVEGREKNFTVNDDNTVSIHPRQNIPAEMLIIIDEAAISGFESRGSGVGSSLHTYLLALSRKLNVDIVLVSQMMCLAKGTLIETPSGMVPIERIKVGDEVVDNTYWGRGVRTVAATSKQTQNKILRIELESGHTIKATPHHRFPVYNHGSKEKEDILAENLKLGDILKTDKGFSWVVKLELEVGEFEVYDLSIEKGAPYFMANGIRSHNSMTDKRAQWLADFYWLCEVRNITGTREVEHFRYRVYNEQYRKTQEFHLSGDDAREVLFGKFDTFDIPNSDALIEAYTIQYQISEEDEQFYEDIKNGTHHIPKQPMKENVVTFKDKKSLAPPTQWKPGATFLREGKRFEVLQQDWNFDERQYQYRAREIPNNAFIEDTDMGSEGAAV